MRPDDGVEMSFDPRSWNREQSPAESPPPAVPPSAPRNPVIAATLASIAILLAGGGAAWRQHRLAPATTSAPSATAVATPPPADVHASRRSLMVAGVQDIAPTLSANGIATAQMAAAAALAAIGNQPGEIHLEFDIVDAGGAQKLTRLVATRDDGAGATLIAKADGGFATEMLQAKLTTVVKVVHGEMDATSFYNAAVNAGITDSLISDFANALAFDFDFQREVRPGDQFEAAFEQKVNPNGDPVGAPTLLYVALSTREKSKALYRFLAPGSTEAGWFDGVGRSTVRALMRTPVDGARISSQFGMREHPVLGFMKLHKGTDFAAPVGTPIFAAGAGEVEWAAMKGPNGNLTILRHTNGLETYYLHQNMFMPGIVAGAHVQQGQKIGEIGTTGRSTGPHLHYEVHVNGEAVNPMEVDTGSGSTLDGDGLAAFKKERDRIDKARAGAV